MRVFYREGKGTVTNSAVPGFLFEPPFWYRRVEKWEEIAALAAALNEMPSIAARVNELRRAGITAKLQHYEESGFSALVLLVQFDESGRKALEEG